MLYWYAAAVATAAAAAAAVAGTYSEMELETEKDIGETYLLQQEAGYSIYISPRLTDTGTIAGKEEEEEE